MKRTIAVYGSKKIQRECCKECQSWAFIISNKFACCDADFNNDSNGVFTIKRMSIANSSRSRPSNKKIKEMLEKQNNVCVYCDVLFGTPFIHPRLKKLRITTVCLDHFVPYSYLKANNLDNFLCACQICNGIKTNKMFADVDDAKAYIKYRMKVKGYDKDETEK